jgi:DNA-binding MarR family transcriptional regulator
MPDEAIQQVRRFNRLVTRRVGALDDSYLSRGRPLGEARLIFEIGLAGADARALRAALGLDSGYLSRLLRALTAEGLVEVARGPGDARVRRVTLTAKGRAELAAYERLSDELARSILAPLAHPERERLLAAMRWWSRSSRRIRPMRSGASSIISPSWRAVSTLASIPQRAQRSAPRR